MITQSPELTAFYDAYYAWYVAECPPVCDAHPYAFDTYIGLCYNIDHMYGSNTPITIAVRNEMKQQFKDARLHHVFPFNADYHEYKHEHGWHHYNPARMNWAYNHTTAGMEDAS